MEGLEVKRSGSCAWLTLWLSSLLRRALLQQENLTCSNFGTMDTVPKNFSFAVFSKHKRARFTLLLMELCHCFQRHGERGRGGHKKTCSVEHCGFCLGDGDVVPLSPRKHHGDGLVGSHPLSKVTLAWSQEMWKPEDASSSELASSYMHVGLHAISLLLCIWFQVSLCPCHCF